MCGRYTLAQTAERIAAAFDVADVPSMPPRYNIAPTQPIPVVRSHPQTHDRQCTLLYWGLIPSWSQDPAIGAKMINARAETVPEKPSFRTAFRKRRCLVIADGFYEWHQVDRKKQPYYFCTEDHQPFGFAGLWEHWESAEGDTIESCTIITTTANDVLQPIHDRMPVILQPTDYDFWLDPTVQDSDRLQSLLQPIDQLPLIRYPVSSVVNSPKNDSPDCIEAIE
ncbi:MAG TPA: SOS response-associated peptidase [Trichocoleus sp.]|jgi:putative SOS response-associated peptidase YedK